MKHFCLTALVFTLLFSSCIPGTQRPQPTITPTTPPNPTATITLTPTQTPSPTPDTKTQIINQLQSEGINVDPTSGVVSFGGKQVGSIDAVTGDFHYIVGGQGKVIAQSEFLQKIGVKEGSIVIFDKDRAGYDSDDINSWPQVLWAFNSNTQTEAWKGWIERGKAIAADKEHPIQVGNTWTEYRDFVKIERAFLQPYPKGTFRLKVDDPNYVHLDGSPPEGPPFKPFDDWSKPGFINPIRGGQNFWIVGLNHDEKRAKNVEGVTEQVFVQIFETDINSYTPPEKQRMQGWHFASGEDSKMTQQEFFKLFGHEDNDILMLPLCVPGGPSSGWVASRMVPLIEYWRVFGYIDAHDNSTGKMERESYQFMTTGIISEDYQEAWVDAYYVWYHSLGW